VPEPYVIALFECSGVLKHIIGTFRHRKCSTLSLASAPFTNFTCAAYSRIPQEMDFRMRIMREQTTHEERGDRDTRFGRRLGHLSVLELAKHSQNITKQWHAEHQAHAN
jgi:hypothetical protein